MLVKSFLRVSYIRVQRNTYFTIAQKSGNFLYHTIYAIIITHWQQKSDPKLLFQSQEIKNFLYLDRHHFEECSKFSFASGGT